MMENTNENEAEALLKELYARLGRVVFVHIPSGEKSPRLVGWNKITFEQSMEKAYQDILLLGNIGALLGEPSDSQEESSQQKKFTQLQRQWNVK